MQQELISIDIRTEKKADGDFSQKKRSKTDNNIVINLIQNLIRMPLVHQEMQMRVLADIAQNGETTRMEVSLRTGLSNSTVSRAVRALLHEGLAAEKAESNHTPSRGRPKQIMSLNPDLALVAGIELGVTTTRLLVCNATGELQATYQGETGSGNPDAIWSQTFAALKSVSPNFGQNPLDQCAVAVPGAVAGAPPIVSNAPNLAGIEGTKFIDAASNTLPNPISIDNDVNRALIAELLIGQAGGIGSASMVTIGTGLGTAISINRNLLRGQRGLVGEFGQLFLGPDGRKLEESITGKGLLEFADSINLDINSPGELFTVPAELAGPALYRFHAAFLTVLTALTVASDPDAIIVGGGIGLRLIGSLPGYMHTIEKNLGYSPNIVTSDLGEFGTAAGACIDGVGGLWLSIGTPNGDKIDSLASVAHNLALGLQEEFSSD